MYTLSVLLLFGSIFCTVMFSFLRLKVCFSDWLVNLMIVLGGGSFELLVGFLFLFSALKQLKSGFLSEMFWALAIFWTMSSRFSFGVYGMFLSTTSYSGSGVLLCCLLE